MLTLNTVNLTGRLGGDPDVRYFESGAVKVSLTLAVNRYRKNSDNDEPDWFPLELWGQDAEFAANNLRKGRAVSVSGSLKIEHWNDRTTGVARTKPVIRVTRIEPTGPKGQPENGQDGAASDYSDEF